MDMNSQAGAAFLAQVIRGVPAANRQNVRDEWAMVNRSGSAIPASAEELLEIVASLSAPAP